MDCQRVQDEILEAFIATETRRRAGAVEAHVSGCATCAAFAGETARARSPALSAMLAPPPLTPRFRAAVRERVRHETGGLLDGSAA